MKFLLSIVVVLTALSCVSSSAGHFKKFGGGGLSGFHRPLARYPTLALPIYSGYGGGYGGYGSGYAGYGSGYSSYGYGGYGSSYGGYGW